MNDVIVLSLIQGITEFLPISSSSHLIIFAQYEEYNNKNKEMDVSQHMGPSGAGIVSRRKEIKNTVQKKNQ
jgi:Uncharacterized bacitracin resistance protein